MLFMQTKNTFAICVFFFKQAHTRSSNEPSASLQTVDEMKSSVGQN